MIELDQPHTEAQWREARRLIEEYASALNVDLSFQDLAQELAQLDHEYGPPAGTFLIASEDGVSLGCIGVRALSADTAEMKRLYVVAQARGRGLGRILACAAIDAAKRLGYARLLLDTLPTMQEARALYASLGFEPIEAYRFNPIENTTFMQRDLRDWPIASRASDECCS
ncbi:MAG: GNAT family N-acetyltransferase [Steroidobacteraceae bacterium]